mmetsp:Transcript_127087/g.395532  ORF Transcript_127087/g.395532 Transcript_127087/m.395532 type:complete len:120 (+) Transcript_127087:75-434(+)
MEDKRQLITPRRQSTPRPRSQAMRPTRPFVSSNLRLERCRRLILEMLPELEEDVSKRFDGVPLRGSAMGGTQTNLGGELGGSSGAAIKKQDVDGACRHRMRHQSASPRRPSRVRFVISI